MRKISQSEGFMRIQMTNQSRDCQDSSHRLQSNVTVTLAPYGQCQAVPGPLIGHCLTILASDWLADPGPVSRVLPGLRLLNTSSQVI